MSEERYHVYMDGTDREMTTRELVGVLRQREDRPDIWSARLSTGLLGRTDCPAGNRGPKGYSEVVLAVGDEGLEKLVDLGFIPCPTCRPEDEPGFWDAVEHAVSERYELDSVYDFADKGVIGYDARQVDWEAVLPVIGAAPNRLYVPQGLGEGELVELRERFDALNVELPPVGYYDRDAPGRFHEYAVPG